MTINFYHVRLLNGFFSNNNKNISIALTFSLILLPPNIHHFLSHPDNLNNCVVNPLALSLSAISITSIHTTKSTLVLNFKGLKTKIE